MLLEALSPSKKLQEAGEFFYCSAKKARQSDKHSLAKGITVLTCQYMKEPTQLMKPPHQ